MSARQTAFMRRYREANREQYNSYMKSWRANNPDKVRQANIRAKALRRNARVTRVNLSILLDKWDKLCGICHELVTGSYDVDHIVPIAKGGIHTQDNLQLAHPSCNRKKGAW
jgi:5-methylcytosine-specific restriction endonuclease McrA